MRRFMSHFRDGNNDSVGAANVNILRKVNGGWRSLHCSEMDTEFILRNVSFHLNNSIAYSAVQQGPIFDYLIAWRRANKTQIPGNED